MNTITLEEKYILEYIKDILNETKLGTTSVNNAIYHHNTNYCDAASICKYGILSIEDQKKLGIKNYSEDFLKTMDDIESHINGNNGISLAVMGLKDLYPDENEYNPYKPGLVDFIISKEIKTYRIPLHYGNEFLSYQSISNDKIRAVDIRLLLLIEIIEKRNYLNNFSITSTIEKYNHLKNIALTIKQLNLNIPLREMSYQDNTLLDIDKLSTAKTLILKK